MCPVHGANQVTALAGLHCTGMTMRRPRASPSCGLQVDTLQTCSFSSLLFSLSLSLSLSLPPPHFINYFHVICTKQIASKNGYSKHLKNPYLYIELAFPFLAHSHLTVTTGIPHDAPRHTHTHVHRIGGLR